MITVDKGFNEQAVTDRITEHSHVSVLLFDNYQTFVNFVEILYAYKSKDITIVQNQGPCIRGTKDNSR